ncbi:MAG: hypothetical protein JO041_01675 [Acidobacteria bacterium]|nr:hypothetical protein [Acidobacteriota bacterium]
MRSSMRWLLLGVLLLPTFAAAQENGPYVGRWRLNVAKSDYSQAPDAKPKSAVVTITADSKAALKWHGTLSDSNGKLMTFIFSGAEDGKPHPVTGDNPWKSAAYTEGAENVLSAEITMKDGSKMKQEITISGDTLTAKNSGAENSTEVWERVKSKPAGGMSGKGKTAPPQ